MRRMTLALLLLAPLLALPASGCGKKVTTVERRETIQESEPRMVSPGTEVVE